MHLLVITPIFPPAQGGAATYYQLLTDGLIKRKAIDRISVVTERMPRVPAMQELMSGHIAVHRLFPYRAGGEIRGISQYVRYALQNAQYLSLPRLARVYDCQVVVVHSSFHNQLNLLGRAISRMQGRVKLVADVRDQLMPVRALSQLRSYDAVIACSENVVAHLRNDPIVARRVVHIPVIQEDLSRLNADSSDNLEAYDLERGSFLIAAGLIKRSKGTDLLARVYEILRAKGHREPLVLAGMIKDTRLAADLAAAPGVRLLGPLPRRELLSLMRNAALAINLSRSEGMPRASLEALALGCRVLLPQGIPEFDRYCPSAVACSSNDPVLLAEQVERLIKSPPPRYPLAEHAIERVLNAYAGLFEDLWHPDGIAAGPLSRSRSRRLEQSTGRRLP